MRNFALTAATLVLLGFQTGPSQAVEDYTPHVRQSIETYIRPAFDRFAAAAGELPKAVEATCATPDTATQSAFADAYTNVIVSFGGISFLRFGPLIEDHRLDRLAFMPDPRGITQRQIRKSLAEVDQSLTDAATLAGKSVALQGLTALQLVAFDKEAKVVLDGSDEKGAFTCAYAKAIAENVANISGALRTAWHKPDGYSATLLDPQSGTGHVRSPKEAIETIFNSLVTGLIVIRDQEILPTVGDEIKKARASRFPFSRSANGIAYVTAEMEGIRDALNAAGFETALPEDFAWILPSLKFEFDNGIDTLKGIDGPIRTELKTEAVYHQLNLFYIISGSLRDTMALELAGALNLSGGFNALDGD